MFSALRTGEQRAESLSLAQKIERLHIVKRTEAFGPGTALKSYFEGIDSLVVLSHGTRPLSKEPRGEALLFPWLKACYHLRRTVLLSLRCRARRVSLAFGVSGSAADKAKILDELRGYSPMARGAPSGKLAGDIQDMPYGAYVYGQPCLPKDLREASPLNAVIRAHLNQEWSLLIRLEPHLQSSILFKELQAERTSLQTKVNAKLSGSAISPNVEIVRFDRLLELWLERLENADGEGFWQPNIQVLAGTQRLADEVTATYASALGISELFPPFTFQARANVSGWDGDEVPEFITNAVWPFRGALLSGEAAFLLEPPHEEYPGFAISHECRFGVSPLPEAQPDEDRILLGEVLDRGMPTGYDLELPLEQLPRHALITGLTGAGKTNTCKHILGLLHAKRPAAIPFLVLEPAKNEYHEWFKTFPAGSYNVFGIGDETADPLLLNPFVPSVGFPVQSHIDYVCQLFQATFNLFGPQPYMLFTAIHRAYTKAGWNLETGQRQEEGAYPRMKNLITAVEEVVTATGYKGEFNENLIAALKGRLKRLTEGHAKKLAYDSPCSVPEDALFKKPCLIKLSGLVNDDEKAFLMGLLFIRLYEYHEVRSQGQNGKLKHVTLIEEAHRLFRRVSGGTTGEDANPRALSAEIFSNMLAEIRAYGESIILAEQIPQKLVADAIKNSNLKITHRIVHGEDRELIGRAINLAPEQMEELGLLDDGRAVIHFQGLSSAVHVKVPEVASPRAPGHATRIGNAPASASVTNPLKPADAFAEIVRQMEYYTRHRKRPLVAREIEKSAADFLAWFQSAGVLQVSDVSTRIGAIRTPERLLDFLLQIWWNVVGPCQPTRESCQIADRLATIVAIIALNKAASPEPIAAIQKALISHLANRT